MALTGRYRVRTEFVSDLGADPPTTWGMNTTHFDTIEELQHHLLSTIATDFHNIFVEDRDDPYPSTNPAHLTSYGPGTKVPLFTPSTAIQFRFKWLNELLGSTKVQEAWTAKCLGH